jgi:exonuclease SbcC
MKPIKLTVSAFICYADEQIIDFTKLGENGLYLITGQTGSGKTTIFDAISYALYGEASSDARNKPEKLRSQYVDNKVRTVVDFDFISNGKKYNIRRELKPQISRDTKEITQLNESVVLTLTDGIRLDRDKEVKAKIEEIVGLGKDQFAQIVMIAQNDFLRFLQSGTDKRVDILRRIFNTGHIKWFQERLKTERKKSEDTLQLVKRDFESRVVDPYKRDEIFADWKNQIENGENSQRELEKQIESQGTDEKKLAAAIAVAEGIAKLFADLEKVRQDEIQHAEKKFEIDALRIRKMHGAIALHKVKPIADKSYAAQTEHKKANEQLVAAQTDAETAGKTLNEAMEMLAGLPPVEAAEALYTALEKKWTATREKRERLNSAKNDDEYANKQLSDAKTEAETAEKILKEATETLVGLPSVEIAESAHTALDKKMTLAGERLEKLNALQEQNDEIIEEETALKTAQSTVKSLQTEFTSADGKYKELYERFIRSQAGLLARELKEGEACPVCGATAHPVLATLSDENINEKELNRLQKTAEDAKIQLDKKISECAALISQIKTLKGAFIKDAKKVIKDIDADAATDKLKAELEIAEQEYKKLITATEENKAALVKLKADFVAATKRQENGKTASVTAVALVTERTKRTVETERALNNALLEFEKAFGYDKIGKQIERDFARLDDEYKKLKTETDKSKAALEKLKGDFVAVTKRKNDSTAALVAATTLVTERIKRAEETKAALNSAVIAFEKALEQGDFADENAYAVALLTEEKLAEITETINDYDENGKQIKRDIARLERETKDKQKPDIDKLRQDEATLIERAKDLNSERDTIVAMINRLRGDLKTLTKTAKDFVAAEKKFTAIKGVADAANGKLDFETYAQIAYFERILRAANLRLRAMSQNRYVLVRKAEAGDKRQKTGLEIDVLDAHTGKPRSVDSLSGGESFMASLSLALGLSDVVQQSAGSIHLDAMFIDEGFGSLDPEVLDLSIKTLSDMAGNNRVIGIISHVAELRERIDKRIDVDKTPIGSNIVMVV